MGRAGVSLADRTDLTRSPVLLNGTQALLRLMLAQAARDRAAGWRTAGYVTGYRGSPLGGVDQVMTRAAPLLQAADIRFQPALNEDLAATAAWGTQAANLRGEGRVEGVFALWYGKGPGVDRSGDALRHANLAGTAPKGGVLMVAGDDHTGESSTTLHHSDLAMIDAGIPILSPAGVQEVLDYGHYGFALSRFAGLWTGLKGIKDTIESTVVVDGRPDRMQFADPAGLLPAGGLSIRLGDTPALQEARLYDGKIPAAEAFARANGIDRRALGTARATVGIVAAGKSWLDVVQALGLLGIDGPLAEALGITGYKIGQVWPLDRAGFRAWAAGLSLVIVVEEKRKVIEPQLREVLFGGATRLYGERHGDGRLLFPARGALDPVGIAGHLGAILAEEGRTDPALAAARAALETVRATPNLPDRATRTPYFCAGCPHNSSTRLPEGSRAYAGIGCHWLVQMMDRETEGYTQMGGEGANWIGEAPFSTRPHMFQNIGDGTYNHSGLQAIRAAVAAGTPVTYKILYNDAVAMTGGQAMDGGLTAGRIAHELRAAGVAEVAVVHDDKEPPDPATFPPGQTFHPREALDAVQRRLRDIPGVTAIVYVQTCAAEKRRRRKRGTFPEAPVRVMINEDVCEGCGDCGVQSNCVALVPVETPFGRKRQVEASACNADLSCLKGFCPSFVTFPGARPRPPEPAAWAVPDLPEPVLPPLDRPWAGLLTGIGGTGVVTVGAILGMAAHCDGLGVGTIEMTGMAQKGGAVTIHVKIARQPHEIAAIRVAAGEADAVLGGDLVVTAAAATRAMMARGRTRAVLNADEVPTGAFTRDPGFRMPANDMIGDLQVLLGAGLAVVPAGALARAALGDAVFANMVVLGAAWQAGMVPVSAAAIGQAIALNGAAAEANARAFALGRWAAADPRAVASRLSAAPAPDRVDALAAHLALYQDAALAARFRARVAAAPEPLREAVARGYHRLLAPKDEYEVARLHLSTLAQAAQRFAGKLRPVFHLAPPFLPGRDPNGRPRKRAFGPWVLPVFRLLARLKGLRGTWADPFARTAERRADRARLAAWEADMDRLLPAVTPATEALVAELAALPDLIRGYGPVREAAAARAAVRRLAILAALDRDPAAAHMLVAE
jgi:indolepyruvate ferredoxin oxidoreductase